LGLLSGRVTEMKNTVVKVQVYFDIILKFTSDPILLANAIEEMGEELRRNWFGIRKTNKQTKNKLHAPRNEQSAQ
jgi:hypothetical protein